MPTIVRFCPDVNGIYFDVISPNLTNADTMFRDGRSIIWNIGTGRQTKLTKAEVLASLMSSNRNRATVSSHDETCVAMIEDRLAIALYATCNGNLIQRIGDPQWPPCSVRFYRD